MNTRTFAGRGALRRSNEALIVRVGLGVTVASDTQP